MARRSLQYLCGIAFRLALAGSLHGAQRPAMAYHGFCSANFPGSVGYNKTKPTYFTQIFPFADGGIYDPPFGEYVAKKYAFQPAPSVSCGRQDIAVNLDRILQTQMQKAKERGAPDAVLTEWTIEKHKSLMAGLAKRGR